MNATKHSRPADTAAAAEGAREAEARALKHLKGRLWHFTSIGLGNCRAAQKVRSEIEQRQQAEALTRSATARNREPSPPAPRPLAPLSVEQLTAGLSHLATIGMVNSRAAQKLTRELQRRITLNSQFAALNHFRLANDNNFNPDEPRDKDGKWTTGGTSSGNTPAPTPAAANPAKTPGSAPEQNPPPDELRPLTRWERFTSDLRQLEHKWLPGTRTGQLNPSRWPEFKADIGKVLHTLGEFGKAVVGDVAAGMRADPEFSGNLPAFFKGEELPIDKALRDAALEQQFRGEVPIATIMGRISEGLASTAPMVPLMGGLPAAAQKAALALFTAKMVQDTPEIARQLGTEFGKPPEQRDPDKIDSLVAQAIQTVGFAAAGGVGLKRSFTPAQPPAPEKFPVEWRDIQRPESGTGTPPTDPAAPGPYSNLPDHPSVGPGKDFTKSQKARILEANENSNGGVLKDDQTGEVLVRPQQSQKGVTPPSNEAHIDHVFPKSRGGSNSFQNAEVRSRANNLQKGNKVER